MLKKEVNVNPFVTLSYLQSTRSLRVSPNPPYPPIPILQYGIYIRNNFHTLALQYGIYIRNNFHTLAPPSSRAFFFLPYLSPPFPLPPSSSRRSRIEIRHAKE